MSETQTPPARPRPTQKPRPADVEPDRERYGSPAWGRSTVPVDIKEEVKSDAPDEEAG